MTERDGLVVIERFDRRVNTVAAACPLPSKNSSGSTFGCNGVGVDAGVAVATSRAYASPARLDPMAKMNVNRARGGDDDFGAVGAEPTMPAKYAGTCATCGQRFAVGDPIASVLVDKKMTYHHGACRYPATALLGEEAPGSAGRRPARASRATTPRRRASSSAVRT